MKIAIAKSLLEPGGIPWPEPYGKILGWIISEFEALLRGYELARMLPGMIPVSDEDCLSIEDVCKTLKCLAEMRGAEDVIVSCVNLQRNEEVVGYMFVVNFREPKKKRWHFAHLKTYFK